MNSLFLSDCVSNSPLLDRSLLTDRFYTNRFYNKIDTSRDLTVSIKNKGGYRKNDICFSKLN